ncbi:MAG: FISUMP domain-containing protein [Cyclobacteriaceae bacterium]
MKLRNLSWILLTATIFTFLSMLTSCSDDDSIIDDESDTNLPEISLVPITKITTVSATSGGTFVKAGSEEVEQKGLVWSTATNPDLNDNFTEEGPAGRDFTSVLTGLSPATTYSLRAYATTASGTTYSDEQDFTTSAIETITDSRDGNVYQVVAIGDQIWMAENLRYLPSVVGPETGSTTEPYYYVGNYDGNNVEEAKLTDYYSNYGVLYNWPAAMAGATSSNANPSGVRGVCPEGWHLPSDAEWAALADYLGGKDLAGDKMKETQTTLWANAEPNATNESGFSALPGGYRFTDGMYYDIGNGGYWWCTDENSDSEAYHQFIYNTVSFLAVENEISKEEGKCVRCVMD